MNKLIILLTFLCCSAINQGQTVGIGNTTPSNSSILDLSNTLGRGLLLPQLTDAQMNALGTAPNGLTVYNTSQNGLYLRRAGQWQRADFSLPYKAVINTTDTMLSLAALSNRQAAVFRQEDAANSSICLPVVVVNGSRRNRPDGILHVYDERTLVNVSSGAPGVLGVQSVLNTGIRASSDSANGIFAYSATRTGIYGLSVGSNLGVGVFAAAYKPLSYSLYANNDSGTAIGARVIQPGAYALELVSADTIRMKLASEADFGAGMVEWISGHHTSNNWRPSFMVSADAGDYTGRLDFYTNGTTSANRYGVKHAASIVNGKMGIGTNNPGARLELSGTGGSARVLRVRDATMPDIEFMQNNTATGVIKADVTGMDLATATPGGFITFSPANSLAMSLSNAGNLGIGTPVPGARLEVSGTGSTGRVLLIREAINPSISFMQGNTETGDIKADVTGMTISTPSPGKYITFSPANNMAMSLSDAGNLGIGAAVPIARLEVSGTGSTGRVLLIRETINPSISFMQGSTETGDIKADVTGITISTPSPGKYITFSPANNMAMSLSDAGNVGIGNPVPATKLDVYVNADIWHTYIGGQTGRLQFAGQTGNGAVIQSINPTSGVVRDLYLQRDGGNIGIGNTNPQAKLQVSGSQRIDFVSGSIPHLLLYQFDAGYARLGFQNTNGKSWTIAATRTGSAATDQLNFFNEQVSADRFILYGNGNATLSGTLTQLSDMRLKRNIRPLNSVLPSLLQLNGYMYEWKDDSRSGAVEIGLLAQEVEKVYPQLVRADAQGHKSVAYQNLVPVLLEAVKELQQQVQELRNEMKR